jgi:hypothetical protein
MINRCGKILEMIQRRPRPSTRRMASRMGTSLMQMWRILHGEEFYPYDDQRAHLEPVEHAQSIDVSICATGYKLILNC